MKVFFTASYYGKDRYQKYYDHILKLLREQDVEVISPELGNYTYLINKNLKQKLRGKPEIHYAAIKKGILWADAVIIEISHEDFQLGHEVTLAALHNKPVLCLSLHENFSEKIQSKNLFGAKYTRLGVGRIIRQFLSQVNKQLLSERFNLFLTKSQLEYLEIASYHNNLNKSEYIRKLIEDDKNINL